jgi:hypothetical protein
MILFIYLLLLFFHGVRLASILFKGAFTPNDKLVLTENLGGILGGTQC